MSLIHGYLGNKSLTKTVIIKGSFLLFINCRKFRNLSLGCPLESVIKKYSSWTKKDLKVLNIKCRLLYFFMLLFVSFIL